MTLRHRLIVLWLCLVALIGCIPDDAERCRDGYVLIDASCWPDSDTVYGTSTSLETSTDSSTHEVPSGLGDPCESDDDCATKAANYCALDPRNPDLPGSCALVDCDPGPTICPAELGLVCCAFANVDTYPSMCIPEADYEELKELVGC